MHMRSLLFLLIVNQFESTVFMYDFTYNITREFDNDYAQFGPILNYDSNITGFISIANPIDGCVPIQPPPIRNRSFIVLVERGGCSFDQKVYNAQEHYKAVIIYNNEDDSIFPMNSKNGTGINIVSVIIGLKDGLTLQNSGKNLTIMIKNDEFNMLFTLLIPIIIFILIVLIVTLGFLIYRFIQFYIKESKKHLSKRNLRKLKKITFNESCDRYETCAICLDDFVNGEKLRILPCNHGYHCKCIDPWLLKERRVCPICKFVIRMPGEEESSELDEPQGPSYSGGDEFADEDTRALLDGDHHQRRFNNRLTRLVRRIWHGNNQQVPRQGPNEVNEPPLQDEDNEIGPSVLHENEQVQEDDPALDSGELNLGQPNQHLSRDNPAFIKEAEIETQDPPETVQSAPIPDILPSSTHPTQTQNNVDI